METLDAIRKRGGCRKYLDKPLERDKLGVILDAGRLAPSAGNLQDRSFIIVEDQEKRKQISFACGNQTWMQSAPVHVVLVAEGKKNRKFYGDKGEKIFSIQDTAFAVENMLLAATDMSVGSSLVIGFNDEQIRNLLVIPEEVHIHAVVTLGYASEEVKPSAKYELDKFVYFEEYGKKVENMALVLGEYSTLREQATGKAVAATKRTSIALFDKIKSLFKKKEPVGEDQFMVEQKVPVVQKIDVGPSKSPEEIIKEHQERMRAPPSYMQETPKPVGKQEIPRELPKHHKKTK